MGCKTYIKEALSRVENWCGKLEKSTVPMRHGDHPEEDKSEFLSDSDHKKYHALIGMLVWLVIIGRLDLTFVTSSLSRFVAAPRQGHLKRVLKVFSYIRKSPNKRIVVDSSNPDFLESGNAMDQYFTKLLEGRYPWAKEEIDPEFPSPSLTKLLLNK